MRMSKVNELKSEKVMSDSLHGQGLSFLTQEERDDIPESIRAKVADAFKDITKKYHASMDQKEKDKVSNGQSPKVEKKLKKIQRKTPAKNDQLNKEHKTSEENIEKNRGSGGSLSTTEQIEQSPQNLQSKTTENQRSEQKPEVPKKKFKKDKPEPKMKKQAEFMNSFFRKTPIATNGTTDSVQSTNKAETTNSGQVSLFRPFQVKSGMVLAPICRRTTPLETIKERLQFISENKEQPESFESYISEIKKNGGRKSAKTICSKDDDLQIINPKTLTRNNNGAYSKFKLLQFHENVRPAFFGVNVRPRPTKVRPRAPFSKEEDIDYDFDSDDEWEEEPVDGEDIGDKDDDDKEEDGFGSEDDQDEEDDFLVPHGYLSDDEGGGPEIRDKESLKSLEEQYYRDLKRQKERAFPVIETENLGLYRMRHYPSEQ